jgi:hypothetical protein
MKNKDNEKTDADQGRESNKGDSFQFSLNSLSLNKEISRSLGPLHEQGVLSQSRFEQ